MTVEEHFLALVQIGPRVTPTRRREPHDEHRDIDEHARQIHARRPEIDLGFLAQRVTLRDHHLDQRHVQTPADLGHVTAHRRLAHQRPVLLPKPLPYPPGGVSLLTGAVRSAANQPSIVGFHRSNDGAARAALIRSGGTADANA